MVFLVIAGLLLSRKTRVQRILTRESQFMVCSVQNVGMGGLPFYCRCNAFGFSTARKVVSVYRYRNNMYLANS